MSKNFNKNENSKGEDFKSKSSSSKSGKGRSNCRSRKGSSRRNDKSFTKDDVSQMKGSVNDSSYYYTDNTVLDQVMNFSFNQYGGVPLNIRNTGGGTLLGTYVTRNVMSIRLNPAIPFTRGANVAAGIDTAGLRNFLTLSGSNAKTTNYAPQDVTILMLAVGQVISMSSYLSRALGVAYLFNYRNRDYPTTLLTSMGIDAADFADNLAYYRVRFNTLLATASKIPFPAGITYFRKCAEQYASMYTDSDNSALAQTYMFNPASTWKFNETYDANGAGLDTVGVVPPNGATNRFANYLTIFQQMIDALLNSTSLNYIYSDILRLQQSGKITDFITYNSIPENWIVMPQYNPEIETWIHNATILGSPLASTDTKPYALMTYTNYNDVSCDASKNRIVYRPQFKHTNSFGYEALVDFRTDNVTPEMKVAATRLSARWNSFKDGTDWYTEDFSVIDSYIVDIVMLTDTAINTIGESFYDPDAMGATNVYTGAQYGGYLSQFDWHPLWYLIKSSDTSDPLKGISGDLNFYTTLNNQTIYQIYNYEVLHLFQIG